MYPSVAVVYPGRMGSALGRQLADHGLPVKASLSGRSSASADRASAAGLEPGDDASAITADLVLSVVPPVEALPVALRLADMIGAGPHKPVYVDLNAKSPETAAQIETAIAAAGAAFVDGCIIGTVPRPGYDGPWLHLSGPHAPKAAVLGRHGLNVDVIDGPNGTASALKMCFAGIMKGLTALGCASTLAATRSGIAEPLLHTLERSQPELWVWFRRQIPAMYPKTWRWIGEMEEIAGYLEEHEGAAMFEGAARLFAHLSDESDAAAESVRTLQASFGAPRDIGDGRPAVRQ
ncbi:MAG: NAD(P)-dependent oxidoreductase [Rhodobiaceae bacterium]|nr:NAD(P)-dependent oxidoreductase [Rhodobiaceae bacterium]